MMIKKCKSCNREFKPKQLKHSTFCSQKCSWVCRTIGYHISSSGYRLMFRPDHPQASKKGYVPEHRLVMMELIGRFLDKDEVVHHINANRLDNRIENLQLIKRSDIGKANMLNTECPKCHHIFHAG